MLTYLILWSVLILAPAIYCLIRQKGFKYLLMWEAIMLLPIALFALVVIAFIAKPVRFQNQELYLPRVNVREFYLGKPRQ